MAYKIFFGGGRISSYLRYKTQQFILCFLHSGSFSLQVSETLLLNHCLYGSLEAVISLFQWVSFALRSNTAFWMLSSKCRGYTCSPSLVWSPLNLLLCGSPLPSSNLLPVLPSSPLFHHSAPWSRSSIPSSFKHLSSSNPISPLVSLSSWGTSSTQCTT